MFTENQNLGREDLDEIAENIRRTSFSNVVGGQYNNIIREIRFTGSNSVASIRSSLIQAIHEVDKMTSGDKYFSDMSLDEIRKEIISDKRMATLAAYALVELKRRSNE